MSSNYLTQRHCLKNIFLFILFFLRYYQNNRATFDNNKGSIFAHKFSTFPSYSKIGTKVGAHSRDVRLGLQLGKICNKWDKSWT